MTGEHIGVRTWLGIDVGGPRKGFDVALIDEHRLLELRARMTCADVVAYAREHRPALIGIDSPRSCAPDGELSRADERAVARICGIRYTPDAARVHGGNPYYAWIVEGLRLHRALDNAVEVFPTASFTRWAGPRGTRSRAAWTRAALDGFAPPRTNQDQRDAIAAALTVRGPTQRYGEIAVPYPPGRWQIRR